MSYASEQAVLNNQWNAAQEANITEQARRAPHVLMRPTLSLDGTMWCALYGDDLMDGVAGFGETPEKAMEAFDEAWRNQRTPAAVRSNLKAEIMEKFDATIKIMVDGEWMRRKTETDPDTDCEAR